MLITIIVVLLATLMFFGRRGSEGFMGAGMKEQMQFGANQSTYFFDQADKAILTNPGISLFGLKDALSSPDVLLPVNKDRDFSTYFMEDPENAFSDQDSKFCRGARMPKDLPQRKPRDKYGCGWYFYSDPNRPSVGTFGTRSGPLFANQLGGGQWIWDLNVAQMREDIKNCKRVRDCSLLELEGFKGECGFCKERGFAVPIKPDGSPKYPNVSDALCGGNTFKTYAECIAPPKVITESGVDCKGLGFASPDNSIRLYSSGDCSKMGGTHIPNGECLKPGGGSYSWDCRGLNTPAAPTRAVCDPDARGNLSRACLIQLATSVGLSESGNIVRMLRMVQGPNDMDTMAIDELRGVGLDVPNSILGGGNIDRANALAMYRRIVDMMRNGPTDLSRKAAMYLAVGGMEFDTCDIEGGKRGPFSSVCLQRAWRQAGCQAGGEKYPNRQTVSEVANMSWAQVNSLFRNAYNAMKSDNPGTQDKAIKDCLGPGAEFARTGGATCWKCLPGLGVPLRKNANGDIECASYDRTNCLWSSEEGCRQTLANMPTNLNPLVCTEAAYRNPIHWCARARNSTEFGGKGNYEYLGCFGDSWNRAIPTYTGNVSTVEQCKNRAEQMGMNTFGLQYYGECWVGNNPPYAKYGMRSNCGTLGVDWTNNVYQKS